MQQEEFNQEVEHLLVHDPDHGTLHGKVCIVCDKFVSRNEEKSISLKILLKHAKYLKGDSNLSASLRASYKFSVANNDKANAILKDCLLSPRSKILQSQNRKRCPKIICCSECRGGLLSSKLKEGHLPRFAIANNMAIGEAPPCLTRLNEIELALLSQARFRGHLFTYWGGCHRSIKGWHSFYEVDSEHTAAVLQSVSQFTKVENIGVVLCGPFTPVQKERVLKKIQINVDWVLEAFEWLKKNNRLYKDAATPSIGAPTVIDNSEQVESENTDIEVKEEMKVVFPDGTIRTGGLSDGAEFDKAVAEIRSKCKEAVPFLTSRPSANLVKDYENENLMRAFPLQFPYGYGFHDDFNVKASQNGYLKHLVSLSIPAFHEACFVLVVHNMFERSRALNGAVWQVMGGKETCDVTEEELNHAIARQRNGLEPVNGPGKDFLRSVQSVKKNMAHTNAAAQAAQAKFLSLSHHFGSAKALLTVSFDDSLDIRILALSGKEDTIAWLSSLDNLTPTEVSAEMDQLEAIRCKYPGLCALNFEWLLDLVLDKIVGDNDLKEGLFGTLAAYGVAVEEQGRKTLHGHILIYTTEWNDLLKDLHSVINRVRKKAEQKVVEFVDSILSTELVPGSDTVQRCPECRCKTLELVEQQQLRNLRHKIGCRKEKGVLAKCSNCERPFQGDELALKRATPKDWWDLSDEEVKAKVGLELLKATSNEAATSVPEETVGLVNYRFNHHLDRHTKTCFKKGDEGRCNLPDIEEPKTHVLFSDSVYEVFDWKGSASAQNNITIRPKRLPQDAYTNAYCKAISESKCPCNSNVSVATGARSTIYCSCYAAKATQKEDTQEFKKMGSFVANRWSETRNENTLFEGLSRLMGAVVVGTSEHVCAAPMAAYLVRNQSRFKFSVNFKYVPVREAIELITRKENRDSLKMSILPHEKGCFLTSEALHYLLRPKAFENHTMMDFFTDYEVVRKSGRMDNEAVFDIEDTEHPGSKKQVIRKRKEPVIAQFSQWTFPDAASFGGDIMTMTNYPVNSSVENYCRAALVLYVPFRSIEDITISGSFHKKFRSLFHNGVPNEIQDMLSNIQLFYNSMRLPPRDDPLHDSTAPFAAPTADKGDETEEEDDDNFFDGIFDVLGGSNQHATQNNGNNSNSRLSLQTLRKEGRRGCGFYDLPELATCTPKRTNESQANSRIPQDFVSTVHEPAATSSTTAQKKKYSGRDQPSLNQLMALTYRNTRRRIQASNDRQQDTVTVDADGTVLSIIEWSLQKELNLDTEQQLAFQIATAAYVLTYYDDARQVDPTRADEGQNIRSQMRHDFIVEKKKLRRLARLKASAPLRMFLDGAGGSGKSRVVNEILKYAKDYTSKLNLTFDMRTIVVTALSGVAATSIGGETLHSAASLNGKVKDDDVSWVNARLLIIDEVSFMNTSGVETLDEKLRCLLRKHNVLFGGIHILFCGDFRQLEPCSGKPLYSPLHADRKWATSVNCYLELQGLHRFKDDPEWGRILRRIRNCTYTHHDIDAINECLINSPNRGRKKLPGNASYCVYTNADRTAINAGIFSNVLKAHWKESTELPNHILAIKASEMTRLTKSGKKVPMVDGDKQHIYEHCGDHRVQAKFRGQKGGHFVDPLLKLYYHAPLMLLTNDDVPNGHANGTRVLLEAVVLKDSVTPQSLVIDGLKCPTVEASDVDHLLCSLEEDPTKLFEIPPKCIEGATVRAPVPQSIGGTANATVNFNITLTQIPLVVNNATTGHKLQGQTKEQLVVSVWSTRKNWNYVALSRVKTRAGLNLVKELPYTADFSISDELRQMLDYLRCQGPEPVEWDLEEEQLARERRRRHSSNT